MKTVILCGGRGTRIKDISQDEIPKPMIRIGKYPILWHIMNHYAYYGHKDFILCLGYLGWEIKKYFLNYQYLVNDIKITLNGNKIELITNPKIDWKITMAETGIEAMTGSRIYKIKKYVESDDLFMLTYGDGLSNININDLIKFHKSHGKIGTVTAVRPLSRFGHITISKGNIICDFKEKPQTTKGWINGGFFVFDAKRIWKYLDNDDNLIFEREPLMNMAKDNQLAAYTHEGFWQPMDTFREYKYLNELYKQGIKKNNVPWPGEINPY